MGYMEEALALKEECMKRHRKFRKKALPVLGKDTNTREEKKIDEWFSSELKKLQQKYNITPQSPCTKEENDDEHI